MKKILLLLCALLGTVGAIKADPISDVSQLSNSKAYTINSARGAWTLNTAGTALASTLKTNGTEAYDDADSSADAQQFAIYKFNDHFYIYSLKAKQFVVINDGNALLYEKAMMPFAVSTSNNGNYPLRISTWDNKNFANNNNSGAIVINTWTYQDDGNRLAIEEAKDLTTEEQTEISNAINSSPLLNKNKSFTVKAGRGMWCANAAGNSLATTTTNTSPAEGDTLFALVMLDNTFYLYNVGSQKFLKKDGSLKEGRGDAIYVRYSGDSYYPYMFYFPDGPVYFNMQNGGGGYAMNNYSYPDGGNKQYITLINVDPSAAAAEQYNRTVDVTYNLVYEGEQVATATVTEALGANASLPSNLDKGIFNYTYSPTCNQTNATTITVTAIPKFTISPDYVGATWYNMYIRNNDRWVSYSEDTEPYLPYAATDEDKATKALQWAFVGNPFTTGIKVINRAAGRTKSLTKDGDNAVMREGDNYWDIFGRNNGILLRVQGTDNTLINQAGGHDGPLKFWNNAYAWTDDGSTMWLVEAPVETATVTYKVKYNGNVVAETTGLAVVNDPAPVTIIPTELQRNYVNLTGDDTQIIEGNDDVIELTATWNGPFKFSSSFDEATWYYAKLRGTKYLRADEENKDASGRYTTNTTNEGTDVYKWAFFGNPYAISIANKGAGEGKYLYAGDVPTMQSVVPADDVKARWIIAPGNLFSVRSESGATLYINDASGAGNMGYWNTSWAAGDSGSQWTIEEVPQPATLNILFNGKVVATIDNSNQYLHEAPIVPAEYQSDFVTFTYDVETITTSTNEINATATWNGPFEISADYASAHWYDMAMRRTWYVTSDNKDDDGALKTVNANAMGLAEDAYQWAFVGPDPWHIQLYNKAEGSEKVFNAAGVEANQGIPTFSAGPYYWNILKSSTDIPNAFLLNARGTACSINQFGGAGGSLKFWNSTNNVGDEGSAFTVFDVPTDFHEFAVAEIQPYVTPTGYFALTDAVKSQIGWQDSYATECPFEDYKSMKLALQEIDLTDLDNYILPETGYYRFFNAYYEKYMGLKSSTVYGNYSNEADINGAATIVKLTKNEEGKYSIAIQGKYLQGLSESQNVPLADEPAWFTPVIPAVGYGTFSVDGGQHTYIHCAGGGNIVGWASDAAASLWNIEKASNVSVTLDNPINDNYYATLCVPFDVTVEGATAYTVTKGTGNVLTTTEVEGTIAAGTPVLLIGSSNSATATIAENAAYSSAISTETALTGSYLEVAGLDGATNYVLGKDDKKAGFFHTEGTTVKANSAYLAGDESTSAIEAFYFDLDSTGLVGDVNGDGGVTIADVTALVNIILGKDNVEPYQYNHDAADVNGDKSVTIADVTALVNIILGKNN